MRGRVCLITGGTSGIGREAALALADLGATVLIVGRDASRGEAVVNEARQRRGGGNSGGRVDFLAADFSSLAAVRALAAEVRARHERLHVLLNNAGGVSGQRRLTVDGIERTFAVNHLATFVLTQELLPLLRASAPARVVTVSSEAHRMLPTLDFDNLQGEQRYKMFRAYAVSKLANVLFTYELARRLAGSGVTANCLHPGVVRTGIWGPTRGVLGVLTALAKPFMLSAQRGARPLVKLAGDPALAATTGRYFLKEKEAPSSPVTYDTAVAARLWEVSVALAAQSEK
ncbi:MAG: SDR family oxidoreductase [Verrucomicrobia bacterium]|nr:SDR family oxidoreductase [Verrucomicrobiota bacterium]